MPRIRRIQSSFNAGVLDPRLAARIDLKAYYDGAETLDNAICIPQGGASRRPGLEYIDELPKIITRVTGQTITTPRGGTGANANDGDVTTDLVTTTNIGTINPYVVVHYDLGSAKTIKFADAVEMSLTSATNSEFFIQYSTDDITFVSVGDALTLSTSVFTGRRTPEITARYWRIARIGATDLTTDKATIAEFNLWEETTISDTRIIPFSFNTEQNYLIIATDQNLGIYKDDVLLVNVRFQITSAQLNEISWTQSADTLIITHKNVEPQRIVRDSSAEGLWVVDDVPLTNIPQHDYGSGAEDVWSTTRGWPLTVTFFQGRMVFGGSLGRPQGIWLSQSNSFFDFDVGTGLADEAIVGALDTDQVNEIRNVVPGRTLEIYTSGGEFVMTASPATPANFAVARQTNYGSAAVKAVSIDGATLFVQRNGQGFREFVFSFGEDAHISSSVSQLSTHLISTPVDIDAVKGTLNTETNYVFLVNTGGDVVVFNTLREQSIAAWSGPWTTASDSFKRVGVLDFDTYFIVERTINSNTINYLEKVDETLYTDSAKYIASHSSATVTGLDHLEGESVRVKIGGAVQANETVSSGSITLDRTPSAESVEVGLDFNPTIKTMPISDGFQDGPTLNREKRVVRCTINRYQSLGILVDGEEIPDRQFGVDDFDTTPDPSDDVTEIYLNGWSKKAQVTITQLDPVPMTILALDLEVSA